MCKDIILLVCSLVFALGIAISANATPLTDAVEEYNVVASRLPSYWDNYQDDQDAAFNDFQLMIDSLAYYIMEDDIDDALAYWDDYVDARDDLETSSATLDNSFFTVFVTALEGAAEKLQDVIDLDEQSETEVAYVDGNPHFSLPATPCVFWKDEGEPPFDEFMEFEFPNLSVGDPASYSSYESETLSDFIEFTSGIDDWLDLGEWYNRHKDAGTNMNAQLANDWDLLCAWCICELEIYLDVLLARGYTEEMVENFCLVHGPAGLNSCVDDQDATDAKKAGQVRQSAIDKDGYRPKLEEDLDKIKEIIEDYLMVAWYWEFPFSMGN